MSSQTGTMRAYILITRAEISLTRAQIFIEKTHICYEKKNTYYESTNIHYERTNICSEKKNIYYESTNIWRFPGLVYFLPSAGLILDQKKGWGVILASRLSKVRFNVDSFEGFLLTPPNPFPHPDMSGDRALVVSTF
jgi:hypothetical protein